MTDGMASPTRYNGHHTEKITSHLLIWKPIINKPTSSVSFATPPRNHFEKREPAESRLSLSLAKVPILHNCLLSLSLARALSMRMPRRKPSFLFTTNSTASAASTRKPSRPELRRAAALLFSAVLLGTLLYSADNIRFITIQSQIGRSSPRQLSSLEGTPNHASGPSDPELGGIQSAADLFDGAKKRVLSVHGRGEKKEQQKCDLFDGEWIYEEEEDKARRYPLYREGECVFLTEQVTCMRNGRRDDRYQRWRWQPRSCSLPRYARIITHYLFGNFYDATKF